MDDDAFIRAIVAQPDDDGLRLAYADWLEAKGRSQRAEFIRVQIELARLPESDPGRPALQLREAELLRAHERSWVPENKLVLFLNLTRMWWRGFVAVLVPHARGVWDDGLKVLAEFPLAEELDFSFCMGDEEFRHMPDLPNLKVFAVGGNVGITNASLRRIGNWRTLRRLRLNAPQFTDEGIAHLTGLSGLCELDLSYTEISDEGLRHLSRLTALESIDLSETGIGGRGLAALRALPRLRRLNLTNSRVPEQGLGGLVGCQALEELRLGTHHQERPLEDSDLAPLVNISTLKVLDLGWWCEPSESFLVTLRQRLALRELRFNRTIPVEPAVAADTREPKKPKPDTKTKKRKRP
jgi:uncharacterized protein (TIGR02996 family)